MISFFYNYCNGKQKTYYFWINFVRGKCGNEFFVLFSYCVAKIRVKKNNVTCCDV